jgi:SAM-dependent methyltransferase
LVHLHARRKTIQPTSSLNSNRPAYNERKQRALEQTEQFADVRQRWIARHDYYYEEEKRHWRFLVPDSASILELGCGTGDCPRAERRTGYRFQPRTIERAGTKYPNLRFRRGHVENLDVVIDPGSRFDVILLQYTIGALEDCLETFRGLLRYCRPPRRATACERVAPAPVVRPFRRLPPIGGLRKVVVAPLLENWKRVPLKIPLICCQTGGVIWRLLRDM